MAGKPQISPDATTKNKRMSDDPDAPRSAPCKATEFSASIIPPPSTDQSRSTPPPPCNTVPPPPKDLLIAMQHPLPNDDGLSANAAGADDGVGTADDANGVDNSGVNPQSASAIVSYGFHASNKKMDIPINKVGVIIGKNGDTIKYIQLQSGAKIQFTHDSEVDLSNITRPVELMGTTEQIASAEQLINKLLVEYEQGGSGLPSKISTGHACFVMKIPASKVGLVIGKGGEAIKGMEARSGARIQVMFPRKPPGDVYTERTVQINGTSEQIEAAKQLVNEVIRGGNHLDPTVVGGYPQLGYQARPPTGWVPPGAPQMQQTGYGYVQPGSCPGSLPLYNMGPPPYPIYSQSTSGGYSSNCDRSTAPATQLTSQDGGYDYYNQQPPAQQQPPGASTRAGDNTGYNYNEPLTSGYSRQQGQGYAQDGYGGYQAPPFSSGYGQPPPYDQQQIYNSATGNANAANPTQEGHTSTSVYKGVSFQVAPPVQPSAGQGYSGAQQPNPNPVSYPPQRSTQPGYGLPQTTQAGYGNLPSAQSGFGPGYMMPQTQIPVNPFAYGQPPQQSPGTGSLFAYPPVQSGYLHPLTPLGFGAGVCGAQAAYDLPPSGAPPTAQSGHGQAPPAYAADANTGGNTPASQTSQQGEVAKALPQS